MSSEDLWKKMQENVERTYHPKIIQQYNQLIFKENILAEVNDKLDKQIFLERKQKGRNRLKGLLTDEEIIYDLDLINGIKRDNGNIIIKNIEFKKDMSVRVDMFGEEYIGFIKKIDNKCIVIQEKTGGKTKIQIESLRNGRVKIYKE